MFKKLKEKITEEVKSSPQRLQQFTQSVSDRLQTSIPSEENFFSIGEDDTSINSANAEAGFSNISLTSPKENTRYRRNSNTSMASDVSFLPRYELNSSLYHMQSDLDVSASEVEDNASSASSQLGHLSKEQIYSAFSKSQSRYHKYRGRYTDLARHYKDLERENGKMKLLLEETQDKAIRRVNELKEQCTLEQKAKAHLEGALRDELDEKQFKIDSLETKIGLIQHHHDNDGSESVEEVRKYLNDARNEIESLNLKIQELKANSIVFQTKEQEYRKEIALFYDREKENNLKLAQSKMELHNEILSKDAELASLKRDNETLRISLDEIETQTKPTDNKLENLQRQNKKLIDKVESLTLKNNHLDSELLKVEKYKIEIADWQEKFAAKNSENELNITKINEALENINMLELKVIEVRGEAQKALLTLEDKIKLNLEKDYEERTEKLRAEFKAKLDQISGSSENLQKVQFQLFESENALGSSRLENVELKEAITAKDALYKELQVNQLELIEESNELHRKLKEFTVKIQALEADLKTKDDNFEKLEELYEHSANECKMMERRLVMLEKEKRKIESGIEEQNSGILSSLGKDYSKLEAEFKIVQQENFEKGNENIELNKLNTILGDKLIKLVEKTDNFEKELADTKSILKIKEEELSKILQEKESAIKDLHDNYHKLEENFDEIKHLNQEKEQQIVQLSKTNFSLENTLQSLHEKIKLYEEKMEGYTINSNECKLLEMKLAKVEEKNRALLSEFEIERKSFEENLTKHGQENYSVLNEVHENYQKLEQDFNAIKHYNSEKEHQIVELSKINSSLEKSIHNLEEKVKLYEEKMEGIDINSNECKLLEMKLSSMEKEKKALLSEFEMERQLFASHGKEALQKYAEHSKDLEDKLNIAEEEKKSTASELGLIKTSFEEIKAINAKEINELKNKVQKLIDENAQLSEELSKAKFQINEADEKHSLHSKELTTKLENATQDNLLRISELQENCATLGVENAKLSSDCQKFNAEIIELQLRINQISSDNNHVSEENQVLVGTVEALKLQNDSLQTELKSNANYKRLQETFNELEHQYNELNHEKQLLLDEIQELKISPINIQNNSNKLASLQILKQEIPSEKFQQEITSLQDKLTLYKSLDITNKSSIEFYENELQKLRNNNEKLNRKLDETLVTLNHCSELSSTTEVEYLRNILYNYMLGKESLVLARVIAAVCKFDPLQTETVLQKEQQKQTLLGQLGIL